MVVAWALLAATGAVGAMVQVDEESRHDSRFARYVPAPFRNEGQLLLTLKAVSEAAPESKDLAVALVAARPVQAESLSLLALADDAAKDPEGASKAINLAASRGWRDLVAQQAMLNGAVDAGQPEVAVSRLIAIWRAGYRDDSVSASAQRIIEAKGGREAMIKRMASDEHWRNEFMTWGAYSLKGSDFALIVGDALARRIPITCDALLTAGRRIALSGDRQGLARVWGGTCASNARAATDYDWPLPTGETRAPSLYDWQFVPNSTADAHVEVVPGGTALSVSNPTPYLTRLASRIDILAPGPHTLGFKAKGRIQPGQIKLDLVCIGPDGKKSDPSRIDAALGEQDLTVPADCPVQQYQLQVGQGELEGLRIYRTR